MISADHPDRLALVFHGVAGVVDAGEGVSFAELAEEVARECKRLAELPEGAVALRADHSRRFVVQTLALLRLRRPVAVLSQEAAAAELATRREILGRSVELDSSSAVVWQSDARSSAIHPDTGVILFTSGSTGTPKGVQLSHENVAANTRAVVAALDFSGCEQQTLFLPLHYSYGLLGQLLPALSAGVTTHFLPRFTDAKGLFDRGQAAGMWSGVPSHWEGLLRMTDPYKSGVATISHVISAGAPMSIDLRKRLRERFPRATIYNNYGLTEAAPRVLSFSSRHPSFFTDGVGTAVGDLEIRLADDGELCVRGNQVMLGYIGDPEGTRERVRDGWLHSGDVGAEVAPGLYNIVGRKDELFNIGGERTSPVEIDNALKTLDGVQDAAVLIENDSIYGVRIEAFLVASAGRKFERGARKRFSEALARRVSTMKIPRTYYGVAALPRTSNGKLQRGKLSDLRDPKTRIE